MFKLYMKTRRNKICDLWEYLEFFHSDHKKKIEFVDEKIKPHQCNICQLNFGQKGTLKKHVRIHKNLKAYKCDICDYSAFDHSYLKRHIECDHEKVKPHQCNLCKKSFCEKRTLKNHLQKVHNYKTI